MMAVSKGEGLQEFTRVYTDGSVMEDRVGCWVICGPQEIKIRLAKQMCIFNAEAQIIIEAIKATRRWGIVKRILITDSFSNLMAQETVFTKGNTKKTELKDVLAEEGSNLRLMWVPSHMGITGNEHADKAAKEALDQNVETTIKVVKSDYCKWVKEKIRQRWQNEWRSFSSSMVTIKPHVDINKSTEGLPQRQQVAVSRLIMGYTNITHGYKIRDEVKPHNLKVSCCTRALDFDTFSLQLLYNKLNFYYF
jgi:ribonuclease HI